MTVTQLKQGHLDMDSKPRVLGEFITAHKWLRTKGRKTDIWSIFINANGTCIGYVQWFSAWRRFVFYPRRDLDTLFDSLCMRSLADFCDQVKVEHQNA